MSTCPLEKFADLLLRLPRELRDLVYPSIIAEASPIYLASINPHPLTHPTKSNPTIAAEALEAYYLHNTFIVDLDQHLNESDETPRNWGPYPEIAFRQIENLIVLATESSNVPDKDHLIRYERQKWAHLLYLSRPRTLTIKMQKRNDQSFTYQDFCPVLSHLQERHPLLDIRFDISFDDQLELIWHSPFWAQFPSVNCGNSYQPMGYIDVTDLFAGRDEGGRRVFGTASEEDRQYVEEYLPDKEMPLGRSVRAGLLDCFPTERRNLGQHYVVKEPALLKVLLEDEYDMYRKHTRNEGNKSRS